MEEQAPIPAPTVQHPDSQTSATSETASSTEDFWQDTRYPLQEVWYAEYQTPGSPKAKSVEPEVTGWPRWDRQFSPLTARVWGQPGRLNRKAIIPYGRISCPLPFLEESLHSQFIDKPKSIAMKFLLDQTEWSKELQGRYQFMLGKLQDRESVYSSHRIAQIEDISMQHFIGVKYACFVVIRSGLGRCDFSEPDFLRFNLTDFIDVYNDLRNRTIKPAEVQDAETAIVRFMKFRIRELMLHDFQLNLEARQEKVNLTAPTLWIEGIEEYPDHLIVEEPSKGVIYSNEHNEKRILLLNEVNKFSDGTLKMISFNLQSLLHSPGPSKSDEYQAWLRVAKEKAVIKKVNDAIQERLVLREKIRIMERLLGYREQMKTL